MSTQFFQNGQLLMTAFWGGTDRGQVVQMEVTEQEWAAHQTSQLTEAEDGRVWLNAKDALTQLGAVEVVWDSALRQRVLGAQLREHRFASLLSGTAAAAEERAGVLARKSMRLA